MALANYLTQGSYTMADDIVYSKSFSRVSFHIKIYSSSTKEILLGERAIRVESRYTVRTLLGKDLNTPPTNPQIGDSYRIGSEPTGDWQNRANLIAEYTSTGWGFWTLGPNEEFYLLPEQKYYKYDGSLNLVPTYCPFESREYNKFFTQDLIDQNGLQTQIYTYLKSLPGFENVVDV